MIILEENGKEYLLEANYSRRQLLDMLSKDTVVISFRKVSNERDRILYGTRDLERIPKKFHPNGTGRKSNDPDLIPIFDLVKKGWRSFYVKNVSKAEPKKLGFLTRFLRRRKYTKDKAPVSESFQGIFLEVYEVPQTRSFSEFSKN